MATPIQGAVNVGAKIAPQFEEDTYAVIDPIYGVDGLRSVADISARDAIFRTRRRVGMLVYVQSENRYYRLAVNDTVTPEVDKWEEFKTTSKAILDPVIAFVTQGTEISAVEGNRYIVLDATDFIATIPLVGDGDMIEYKSSTWEITPVENFTQGVLVFATVNDKLWALGENNIWATVAGEDVVITNVGTGTLGIFKGINGTTGEYEFYKFSSSTTITVSKTNDNYTFNINISAIDHDALSNSGGNRHIDHTTTGVEVVAPLTISPVTSSSNGNTVFGDSTQKRTLSLSPVADQNIVGNNSGSITSITVDSVGRVLSVVTEARFTRINADAANPTAINSTIDKNGDLFLNTTTGQLFKIINNLWTSIGSFTGEIGPAGADGTKILAGGSTPDPAENNEGDIFIETDTFLLYKRVESDWVIISDSFEGTLINTYSGDFPTTGAKKIGDLGFSTESKILAQWQGSVWSSLATLRAEQWYTGFAVPSGTLGKEGDLFLNLNNGNVYQKTDSVTWGLTGNIKGADGSAGRNVQVYVQATEPSGGTYFDGDVWIKP